MELISRKKAGGVKSQARAVRRPACIPCQTKKLRCTGSPENCDRCRTKAIACVLASSTTPKKSRSNLLPSRPFAEDRNLQLDPPAVHSRTAAISTATLPPSYQATNITSQLPSPGDALTADGYLNWEDVNNSDTDIEIGEADLHSQTNPDATATESRVETNQSYPLDQLLRQVHHRLGPYLASSPTQIRNSQSHTIFTRDASGNPSQDTTSQSVSSTPVAQAVPSENQNSNSSPPQCTCTDNLVRIVQQIDDDEFRMTTLSLDHVIQLKKWLIFQCCKPLNCPQCVDAAPVHTVLLIICDRLTQIFECIHKRIERARGILAGHISDLSDHSMPSPSSHIPSPAQLFCSLSGGEANIASCNPKMFSDEFRAQYSDEEQVHMIRVLLGLQLRNLGQLFGRLENASQPHANLARQSRIESLKTRLAKASTDIDRTLQGVLQDFVAASG
ncbi:hypothetical protein B0T17DRAFT_490225 [Bombardia bombarda]|uniref:Zn(2)-C6 fungal-type domain-containing protein n=1 Tax=Bombardia bombarda TaxID=252184 RepID=A0AA39XBK4_9PEZI|nr:hypothetical protein B0T17DRAFT_490225 [Bombardia bombarda]